MSDPRDIFYRKSTKLHELAQRGILEIAYEGNIGFHELVQFYTKATDIQIDQLEYYLKTNQIPLAVDTIEIVTGTHLSIPNQVNVV